jgi:uncharacterized protein HemX
MNDASDTAAAGTAARVPPDSGADGAGAPGRSQQGTMQQGSTTSQQAGPATRGDAGTDGRAAAGRPAAARPSRRGFPTIATVLVVGFALLAAGGLWFAQDRVGRIERDLARRLQDTETRSQQLEQQVKLLSDTLRDAQGRAAVLEAKLSDSLGQQTQLRQLYDEIARTRGDLMLADVENSIMIAAQQLQLGGNVHSALLALQDAEQVLARSNQSAMIGLRRVLTRDIERLKGVPLGDFTAAVNRLDAVIGSIEQMTLLADVAPTDASPAAPRGEEPPDGLRGLPQRVARTGLQGWDAFVAELRQLVRVQRVDQPDALLLSPDQRFFARENLRLQLLNARLNLLARNEPLFRADLARATRSVERWFDRQQRTTAAAIASLGQLQATPLSIELPSLAESIGAVRAARAASDAR